jgi:hypothetical protein
MKGKVAAETKSITQSLIKGFEAERGMSLSSVHMISERHIEKDVKTHGHSSV